MHNYGRLAALFVLLAFAQIAFAQTKHLSSAKGEGSIGLGIGLPYGGFGGRLSINLIDELNLFGGIGYQLAGAGYNAGLRKDFNTSGMTQVYLTGMYGTNAVIKVSGLPEYDKVYTGATFGVGVKVNSRKKEGRYWDLGLLVPIRSSSFKDDETTVKNDPRVADVTSPWPVLIVVGYNFTL